MDKQKKEELQQAFVEALREAKEEEEEEKKKEELEVKKILAAKEGTPITITGYGILDSEGRDTGKRFVRKAAAEKYLKELNKNDN